MTDTSNRFANVPQDPDTTITSQTEIQVQNLHALHQQWNWDRVRAESLVFVTTDIAPMSLDDLKDMLRKEGLIKLNHQITTSQSESGYTFINFNFRTS